MAGGNGTYLRPPYHFWAKWGVDVLTGGRSVGSVCTHPPRGWQEGGGLSMQLTPADLLARVGMLEPTTEAETEAVLIRAIEVILKTDNKSGYRDVYKGASSVNPWQAKPYIRPGVQRNLGSFSTPEEAAKAVIVWMYGGRPTPPTPDKERNKRGEGRRKRDRCSHGQGARSHPP